MNGAHNRSLWRFFDGAASVSASTILAVALNGCVLCNGLPLLGRLHGLANREDGIIIAATALLFPTTAALYGGFKLFFAAREAVERKARERGRREGRQAERERIARILEAHGASLSPELVKNLTDDSGQSGPRSAHPPVAPPGSSR